MGTVPPSVDVHQAVPMQYGANGADRRKLNIAVLAADLLPDLRSPPPGMLAFDPKDQLLELDRELAALSIRSTTAIG